MDGARFDTLTRSLTAAGSRRGALATLLGGTLGLLGLAHPDDAAAGGKCKPRCDECEQCKKGKCKKTPNGKKCKKGKCQPLPDNAACAAGTCQGGNCTPQPFCAGKNDCAAVARCGGTDATPCFCYRNPETDASFCGIFRRGTSDNSCNAPDAVIINCGPGTPQCSRPCPDPFPNA